MPDQYFLYANLPNGSVVKRGDAILVEDGGAVRTAFVNMIGQSDGDYYVNALIITAKPAVDYDGAGYRHVSSSHVSGKRFATVAECVANPEIETALRNHFQWASEQRGPDSGERVINAEAPTKPDPRDTDQDGEISPKEQAKWDKKQGKQQ
jgi:hypothetical protein